MKNQKIRSMKVHEQSGYNYKATPTIKETGKGLSSNDFGNSEKSKLEGIEEGAQKNVPVPSKVSELENDSKFQTEEQVQEIRKTVEELGRRMDELTDGNEVAY